MMLRQRLLTAAALIPVIIGSILYLPAVWLSGLLSLVIILAMWEWLNIIGLKAIAQKGLGFVSLVFVTIIMALLPERALFILTLTVWTSFLFVIGRYAHKPLPAVLHNFIAQSYAALFISCIVLALFFHTTVLLRTSSESGAQLLLQVVVLVWLADTGGYFAGKRWGKIPLARAISPKKTWEGVGGALILCILWSLISYSLFSLPALSLSVWIILTLLTALAAVVGDLFESLFKRCYHVKDSGNLLPGHGGILDRIDSLIAALPIFAAGIYFLGV